MLNAPSTSSPSTLLAEVKRVLGDYADQPGDLAKWQAVLQVRRATAAAIASLLPLQKTGPEVEAAFALLELFAQSGAGDQQAEAEDVALAAAYAKKKWPGLLAAMLLVPAWQ